MSGYGFTTGTTGYDTEDRLVTWNRTDNTLNKSWNLSAVGDWNSVTENSSTQSRTHGPTHELLTAAGQNVTTDTKGNMTVIPAVLRPGSDPLNLTWDMDNRLSSADVDNDSTADVSYQFDALGRRVARDDGTNVTVFVQSGQQTIADYASGAAPTSPTYTYYYASYIDEPVMRAGVGPLRYYHRNQQYSITALTDPNANVTERYAYTAYGTPSVFDGAGSVLSSSAESNRHLYTGREWDDELGLYHYRARMYDSISGRFLGRDPLGFIDGYSLYRCYFVMNALDPNGEDIIGIGPTGDVIESDDPIDDPRGPQYLGGLQGIYTLEAFLTAMCGNCAKKCECPTDECQADAGRIMRAALSAWQENYGGGPFAGDPEHPQAVGGWYCYNWADIFRSAFDRVGSKCFSARVGGSIKGGKKFPWDKGSRPVKIHSFLVITVGADEGNGGCSITLDDGFLNGDYVHPGNAPADGEGPYKPTSPGNEPIHSCTQWDEVMPFPVW